MRTKNKLEMMNYISAIPNTEGLLCFVVRNPKYREDPIFWHIDETSFTKISLLEFLGTYKREK